MDAREATARRVRVGERVEDTSVATVAKGAEGVGAVDSAGWTVSGDRSGAGVAQIESCANRLVSSSEDERTLGVGSSRTRCASIPGSSRNQRKRSNASGSEWKRVAIGVEALRRSES